MKETYGNLVANPTMPMPAVAQKPRPKKPNNPYMFFVKENMSRIKAVYYNLPQAEVMRRISDEWNSLTQAQKQPYLNAAEEDRHRYERQCQLMA